MKFIQSFVMMSVLLTAILSMKETMDALRVSCVRQPVNVAVGEPDRADRTGVEVGNNGMPSRVSARPPE